MAPGGSLIYQTDLMERLKEKAFIVYLNEPLTEIKKRIKNAPTRGIIGLKGRTLEKYTLNANLFTPASRTSQSNRMEELANR